MHRGRGQTRVGRRYSRERLTDLLRFFEMAEAAYLQWERLPTTALLELEMGNKTLRLLGLTKL